MQGEELAGCTYLGGFLGRPLSLPPFLPLATRSMSSPATFMAENIRKRRWLTELDACVASAWEMPKNNTRVAKNRLHTMRRFSMLHPSSIMKNLYGPETMLP